MCAVMLIPVAGVELLSSTAAVGQQSANLGLRQRTSIAVRAATDPNLLNYRYAAVACTLSYCCGLVDEQVRVCGGEYSSGCLLSEAQIAEFWSYCCGARKLYPSNRRKHDSTHLTLLRDVLYSCVRFFGKFPTTNLIS